MKANARMCNLIGTNRPPVIENSNLSGDLTWRTNLKTLHIVVDSGDSLLDSSLSRSVRTISQIRSELGASTRARSVNLAMRNELSNQQRPKTAADDFHR